MTRQLRRVAVLMFVLFGALFVNLNYLQVLRAEHLADDNRNTRKIIEEYGLQRGSIVAGEDADAIEIARSVRTDSGPYAYRRRYPEAELYAHITGFYSLVFGKEGLERTADDLLLGGSAEAFARNLGDFLSGRERRGDDVVLTIQPSVQAAAREALGDREGAIVALDPATGGVLALWANPSYNPNRLATFDPQEATAYWNRTGDARRNRALRETYPPGSTFKVVTAAAALENGIAPDDTFDDPSSYTPPLTSRSIPNFGGGLCNGGNPLTLERALEVSCNTTFARLGNLVGPEALVEQAEAFGFNAEWDSYLPLVPSRVPEAEELDEPATAQSAIGQRDVRATPLQMALIAATIANNGVLMRPRIVERVEDFAGDVVEEFAPQPLTLPGLADAEAVSPDTAAALQEMMRGVVTDGSGRNAAIDGVDVAGKTGTAQVGEEGNPTVWFIGFAPVDAPRVAVAVVVPDGGDVGSEATGGQVAAPIARSVMEAALAIDER